MKYFISVCMIVCLSGCNTSSDKDPNQAMDDTARMRDPAPGRAVLPARRVNESELPTDITVKGKMQEAWKWNDRLGENLLVIAQVPEFDDKNKNEFGEEGRSTELNAYHYARNGREFVQVWLSHDAIKSCPFDVTAKYIPGSTTVTDLDNDGLAEIKLQYFKACRSDVSPAEMKLVLVENRVEYALEGLSWVPYGPGPDLKFNITENNANLENLPTNTEEDEMVRTFGRYDNEKKFLNAPPSFIEFARREWIKFVKEKIGE